MRTGRKFLWKIQGHNRRVPTLVEVTDPESPLFRSTGRVSHVSAEGYVFVEFSNSMLQFRLDQLRPVPPTADDAPRPEPEAAGSTVRLLSISENDRRRLPRVHAPVMYRPMGLRMFHHRRATTDVSQGGMRAFSDEPVRVGQKLEVELALPDGATVCCWVRVAWVDDLDGRPAAFDVGFTFIDIADADLRRLATVLRRD